MHKTEKTDKSHVFDEGAKKKKASSMNRTYNKNEMSKSREDSDRGGHVKKVAAALHGKDPYCGSHTL